MTTVELHTIPRPPDRAVWLDTRRPYFNASAAAVLFDSHPFLSPADVAVAKITGVDQAENRSMARGNHLEPGIAAWFAAEHQVELFEPEVMYVAGRVMATLDRRITGVDDEAVEVKTTHKRVDRDGIPDYWVLQAQAQCFAAGLARVRFAVLDATLDLSTFTVERDDNLVAELARRADRFMAAVDLGMLPEGCVPTAEHVDRLHPAQPDLSVALDDVAAGWLVQLDGARRDKRAAEQAEKTARDELARLLGPAEVGTIDGQPAVTWRQQSPQHILDVDQLDADHPDLCAAYRTERPGPRVMRIVHGASR